MDEQTKRRYTKQTKSERYIALLGQIARLEAAHEKRYLKIGRLRDRAVVLRPVEPHA